MIQSLSLNGNEWTVRGADQKDQIPAAVPGCVHLDLRTAGKIPDWHWADNVHNLKWIENKSWLYCREFDLSADLLSHRHIRLVCEGLDTFAVVKINGKKVARADNMFRTWEWDVKPFLRPGRNTITILFESLFPYGLKKLKNHPLVISSEAGPLYRIRGWIRKMQCNFGWDWAPAMVTCGIWRPIHILAYDHARLGDVFVHQDHSRRDCVSLKVNYEVRDAEKKNGLLATVTLSLDNQEITTDTIPSSREGQAILKVKSPQLWWPNGSGSQPLYNLTVDLYAGKGQHLDRVQRQIGLRDMRLIRKADAEGESFYFQVNGFPIFAKGANWIPADNLPAAIPASRYRDLLESTAACNMNMLRVWGGGFYEVNIFYDLCDELGILVWQDFMFACACYPLYEKPFMDNFRQEADQQVRRLGHHACLALWCGNNELEGGKTKRSATWEANRMPLKDYRQVFDKMLPAIVHKHYPEALYWPSSPHSPHGNRDDRENPKWGDAHPYHVWVHYQPLEWFRTSRHRFLSEFGMEAFPHPRTMASCLPEEAQELNHPLIETSHQFAKRGTGRMLGYVLDWFRLPKDYESGLWLTQIMQGFTLQYAVEHWRRLMPHTMGTLYWQLNDCWPTASWATIDYNGRWKAAQYMARRFFAPVHVTAIENLVGNYGKEDVGLAAINDSGVNIQAVLEWRIFTPDGKLIAKGRQPKRLAARKVANFRKIPLPGIMKKHPLQELLLSLELRTSNGQVLSRNGWTMLPPRLINLMGPEFKIRTYLSDTGRACVELVVRRPALYVWLDLAEADARFSDNFFHLFPGQKTIIEITASPDLTLAEIRRQLRCRSLVDTY